MKAVDLERIKKVKDFALKPENFVNMKEIFLSTNFDVPREHYIILSCNIALCFSIDVFGTLKKYHLSASLSNFEITKELVKFFMPPGQIEIYSTTTSWHFFRDYDLD